MERQKHHMSVSKYDAEKNCSTVAARSSSSVANVSFVSSLT